MIVAKNKVWQPCTINQEIRGKLPQKIQSDWVLLYSKMYAPWPSGVYSKDARLVQYAQLNVIHHIDQVSKKNQTITSTDKRKSIQQNPTLKRNKNLTKLWTEGNFPDLTGKVYEKKKNKLVTLYLMRELNVFPLISETNQGCPLLLLLLNIILEVLASALRKGDEKNTDRKKKKYLQLTFLCTKYQGFYLKKRLEISEFSQGYKIPKYHPQNNDLSIYY